MTSWEENQGQSELWLKKTRISLPVVLRILAMMRSKKNNFRLYPMSYQSRHENKSKAHGITHLSHLTQVILLTHMTYDSLTNNCFSKSDSHRYRHFWLPALVKNNWIFFYLFTKVLLTLKKSDCSVVNFLESFSKELGASEFHGVIWILKIRK